MLLLLKPMNCSSYSLGHFMEQEITKLYDPFSSIYSSFLMCKLMGQFDLREEQVIFALKMYLFDEPT